MLSRFTITAKIIALGCILVTGLAVLALMSRANVADTLHQDRRDLVRAVVEGAHAQASRYMALERAGKLTREQAQDAAREALRSIRYMGKEYVFAYQYDGKAVAFTPKPEVEGSYKLADLKDSNGVLIIRTLVDAARQGGGYVSYEFPKPGSDTPSPKVSYAMGLEGWDWMIGTGLYVDDVEQAVWRKTLEFAEVSALIALVALVLFLLVARSITGPIRDITARMARLAGGDRAIDVRGAELKTEIGGLARALTVFRDNALQVDRMATEQAEHERQAAERQRAELLRVADAFEVEVHESVGQVHHLSVDLNARAQTLSAAARQTRSGTELVAATVGQAASNSQAVAAAAEELSASIVEISRRSSCARDVARRAAGAVTRSDETVRSLTETAQKVGGVVGLINQIASQTNLLALNATIEAARAGEAGKGFAVVASEVKHLANQTAKATEDIAGQIAAMQDATERTGGDMEEIRGVIAELERIAADIAAAVEQQQAVTDEIARSAVEVSTGAREVEGEIIQVKSAADENDHAASALLDAASHLSEQSDALSGRVDVFLKRIRSA